MKAIIPGTLAILMILPLACTDSETPAGERVSAGIGNDCGPADGREVWLRVAEPAPADTNPIAACPAYTDGGLRIRILDGMPLDSLKTGSYSDLTARDCRSGGSCPPLRATVKITAIGDWEVLGTYELFDTAGVTLGSRVGFRANRCVLTPVCG